MIVDKANRKWLNTVCMWSATVCLMVINHTNKHGSENSVVEMQYSYQKLDEQISQDVSNSVYL